MKATKIFLPVLVGLFLASCRQKADIISPVEYGGPIMVNFNNYTASEGNTYYTKYDLPLKDTVVNVNVELKLTNTTAVAPEDIYVYLMKVDALVSTYNTANGTSLTPVSGADAAFTYDFSKPVVIKKGTRRATIDMKVNPIKLDLNKQNAVGLGILRVEGGGAVINSTGGAKLVIEFGARNKYDGHYRVTGSMVDAANATLTGFHPYECDLETTGADEVVLNPTEGAFAYQYLYPINSAGSPSGYGSFTPVFIFNTATDKVTAVVNAYGQPAPANGRSAQLNPAGTNQFSANRTLQVSYWMNQPSVIMPHRSTMIETFTYLGPR